MYGSHPSCADCDCDWLTDDHGHDYFQQCVACEAMWANNVPVPEPPQVEAMSPVVRLGVELDKFNTFVTDMERVAQVGVVLDLIVSDEFEFLFQHVRFREVLRAKAQEWIDDARVAEFHGLIATVMARTVGC